MSKPAPRYQVVQHGWGWIVWDSYDEEKPCPGSTVKADAEKYCDEMNAEWEAELVRQNRIVDLTLVE